MPAAEGMETSPSKVEAMTDVVLQEDKPSVICHWCQKNAGSEYCEKCSAVAYCCDECKQMDWYTGRHLVLCEGDQHHRDLHDVIKDLASGEWKWLNSLSSEEKRDLVIGHVGLTASGEIDEELNTREYIEAFPVNHLSRSGEIALMLAGAVNCCYIKVGHSNEMNKKFATSVLEPWFQSNEEKLRELGFAFRHVDYEVNFEDRRCQCATQFCEFVDIGHGVLCTVGKETAENVGHFFARRNPQKTPPLWKDFFKLTLAGSVRPEKGEWQECKHGYISFHYYTPHIFGPDVHGLCCTPCLNFPFPVHVSEAALVGKLFYKCFVPMYALGHDIGLAVNYHEKWSEEELAILVLEASGNSINNLDCLLKGGIFDIFEVGSAEKESLIAIARELLEEAKAESD